MAVLFVAMVAGILSFLFILLVLLYVQHQQRTNIFSRLRRYNILEAGSADDSSRLEDRFRSILARVASPIAEWRPVQDLDFRMRQAGIPLLGGEFMILLFGVSGVPK
jgi:tight adherence protein B